LGLSGLECSLSAVVIGFEIIEPILEHVIEVGHAVLDQTVKSLQPLFGIRYLALERHDAAIYVLRLLRTASSQRGQDPESFMRQFLSWEAASKENKWQGRNITRWRNDEYDKAFRSAEGELDPVKRAALFIRMNDMACNESAVIPVVNRAEGAGSFQQTSRTGLRMG